MSLVYDDEQRLLQDAARGFLSENAPVSALRSLRDNDDETGYSRQLWQQMAEMGWTGIVIEEAHGGMDFGFLGAGILCEEIGRNLTNSPMLSSALFAATLLRLGGNDDQQKACLPAIAAGDLVMAVCVDESPRHNPLATTMKAESCEAGWLLSGTKCLVLDGHVADRLIVLARSGADAGDTDGLSLFLVDPTSPGIQIERSPLLDYRNAAEIHFEAVQIDASAIIGPASEAWSVLEESLDRMRACVAAELLGISRESLERTISYLTERQQFGVPIGSFQALQHRCAELFCEVELLRSLVMKALQAIDKSTDDRAALCTAAKAKACEVSQLATNEAVQMHGGIGMTDEFEIGFFMKRAATLRQLLGDQYSMRDRLATLSGY